MSGAVFTIRMSSTHKPHVSFQHCERHIQSLQTRVLELQQQLAVAVAADRKKDIMIEQLDKVTDRVANIGGSLQGGHCGAVKESLPLSF